MRITRVSRQFRYPCFGVDYTKLLTVNGLVEIPTVYKQQTLLPRDPPGPKRFIRDRRVRRRIPIKSSETPTPETIYTPRSFLSRRSENIGIFQILTDNNFDKRSFQRVTLSRRVLYIYIPSSFSIINVCIIFFALSLSLCVVFPPSQTKPCKRFARFFDLKLDGSTARSC